MLTGNRRENEYIRSMKENFPQSEKLKDRKLIEQLFKEGSSLKKYPIRLLFLPVPNHAGSDHQVAVSVPRRLYKRAVDRNYLKRILREGYRKNKYLVIKGLSQPYVLMFIFTGREKTSFDSVNQAVKILLERMVGQEKNRL